MIIVSRGHTPQDPGSHDPCLDHPEMFYNEILVSHIEQSWADKDFADGAVIRSDKPRWATHEVSRKDNGVYDLMDQAQALGCDARVEVHHNHFSQFFDMGLCIYWGSNDLGEQLAYDLRSALLPLQRKVGVQSWRCVGLPDPNWGRYAAVQDSHHTTVIVEPAWMHPMHLDHFDPGHMELVGAVIAGVMQAHHEKYYDDK